MADSLDDYVIDPTTGQTVRLPSSVASYIGLPKAPPPMPTLPSSMEQRDAERQGVVAFFSPEAEARRKAAPEYWGSPAGQARLAEMEARRADMESRNKDFQSLNPGVEHPAPVGDYVALGRPLPGEIARHAAPDGALHLAQSEAPIGTIQQIGKPTALDMAPSMAGGYATQAQLDQALADQQATIPPPPPAQTGNLPPEQVGMDLQRQGLDLNEKAAQVSGAADQRAATSEEQEITRRNAELDRIRQETAKQEAEKQKRFEELRGNVTKKTDDWATYKIDPGRRWKNASTGRKIGAAIAVAMTALGDALQRKSGPNLALQMILDGIHDDVDLQVKEREHLGDVAKSARTSLDDYRREYGDWQQARAAKLAEEYKRTADEVERIGASAKTDRAKANALAMVGDLRTRAGALENGIATSAWNREMKMAEVAEQKRQADAARALGWANHKENVRQFDEQMKFNREKLAADQKSATDEYLAKASAEQAKTLRESGIKDPTTGQYIMADGQPVLSRNAAEASKVQETVDGTQTMLSTIDRIKAKIANDPGFAKLNEDQKQAALGAELDSLTLLIKDAYGTGALDKGSIEFTNGYTGGDPTKLTAKGLFGALGLGSDAGEKTVAKLDVVAKTAETRALNRLGNPRGFKFARDEKLEQTAANKAAEEARKGTPTTAAAVQEAEPGWFAKPLQDFESFVFGTKQTYKKDQEAAEATGSLRYPGFRADKDAALDTLIKGVQQGDAQAQTRLMEMVRDQKTPGLSDATMTLIEANAPQLIPSALKELPQEKRNLRAAIYAARAHGPSINLYPQGR